MPNPPPGPALLPATLWKDISFEWLWVYCGRVPVTRKWSAEIIVPPGVFFVESGLARIQAGDTMVELPAGTAFFSAPGPRRQWFEEGTSLLSAGFRCSWSDGLPVFGTGLNVGVHTRHFSPLKKATTELFKTVHPGKRTLAFPQATAPRAQSLESWCAQEAAFRTWFSAYLQALAKMNVPRQDRSSVQDQRLQTVLRRLQEAPLHTQPDLGKLAAEVEISTRRLLQIIREGLGTTPQVLWERRRLEQARSRLAREPTPLKEIAFDLGFKHPPHFTAWFKRLTGLTPTEFREGGALDGA